MEGRSSSQPTALLCLVFEIACLNTMVDFAFSQPSASPVLSRVSETVTFSWMIPQGGLWSESTFHAVSPAGSSAFYVRSSGEFRAYGNYSGRATFQGNLSSRNITFVLTSTHTSDAGIYKCGVGGAANIISNCGQMLIVLRKPATPGVPVASPTPVFNKTVTLTCSTTSNSLPSNHGLTITYSYQRDGSNDTPFSGSPYTFTVSSRDAQNYRCRARERPGLESDWSPEYNMVPEYGPYQISLTPSTSSHTVTENQDTISPIKCSANCRPGCNYRWFKNGTTNVGTDATLSLGQAVRAKTGSYRCQSHNKHGDDYSSTVSVNVQYLSRPALALDKSLVMENGTFRLDCSVVSNPTVQMTIKNVDNDTVMVQRNTNTLSHTIQRVQCLHNGTYVCSAYNKNTGNVYTTQEEINVLCSPRLDYGHPHNEALTSGLNDVASFVARIISNPTPSFSWYRYVNDQLIPIPNSTVHKIITSGQQSVLQITVQHIRDYGRYAAVAENNLGMFQSLFTLSQASPPKAPDELTVDKTTKSSVSLRWKSNDNGGSEQIYSVEYQTSGNDWRLWKEGILDPGKGKWLHTVIPNLIPDTQYHVQVYSQNRYGKSDEVVRETKTQESVILTSDRLGEGIGIGIGIGTAVLLPFIIGLSIALSRRSQKMQSDVSSRNNELQMRNVESQALPATYADLKRDNQSGNEYEKIHVPNETTGPTAEYQNAPTSSEAQI